MSTFERYFLQKLLVSLAAIIPLSLLIVVGRLFVRLLDRVITDAYPVHILLPLLSIGALNAVVYLLPFSAMFAVMWVLRQSYYDGEIHAAFSVCIGRRSIYAVLVYFGVPLALLLFYLLAETIPKLNTQYQLLKEQGKQQIGIGVVSPGQFIAAPNDGVIFVERRDDTEVHGIFLSDADGHTVETAAHGRQVTANRDGRTFELIDGRIYQDNGSEGYLTFSYQSHRIWIPEPEVGVRIKPDMMDLSTLWQERSPRAVAELQKRLVIPLSLLLLLFLAECISRMPPGHSHYARLVFGVIIFLVYVNLVSLASKLVEDGRFPIMPGVWMVPIILLSGMFAWSLYQRRSGQ